MEKNADLPMEDRIWFRLAAASPLEKESVTAFGEEDAACTECGASLDTPKKIGIQTHV
jgi:hypothetical protein